MQAFQGQKVCAGNDELYKVIDGSTGIYIVLENLKTYRRFKRRLDCFWQEFFASDWSLD